MRLWRRTARNIGESSARGSLAATPRGYPLDDRTGEPAPHLSHPWVSPARLFTRAASAGRSPWCSPRRSSSKSSMTARFVDGSVKLPPLLTSGFVRIPVACRGQHASRAAPEETEGGPTTIQTRTGSGLVPISILLTPWPSQIRCARTVGRITYARQGGEARVERTECTDSRIESARGRRSGRSGRCDGAHRVPFFGDTRGVTFDDSLRGGHHDSGR
jgi:hypothetical protein